MGGAGSSDREAVSDRLDRTGAPRAPIRVTLLLHTVAHGGVETLIINWARAIDPRRVELRIVCFSNPDGSERPFRDAAERGGFSVRTIPWNRRKPIVRASNEFTRLLTEFRTEVVHTHNIYAEIVGWMAARRVGARVMTTQYVWSDFGWKRNLQQWFAALLLRRFDLVTSQCETTRRETTRRGIPVDRQAVLTTGIEPRETTLSPTDRSRVRSGRGCSDDHVILINVARLYPEKAQDLLLDAFAELVRERDHLKLWILGVGPLEADLRRRVSDLKIDDHVLFLGFESEFCATLLAADIQVHPSNAEGVPLALCEGMAVGMPIVATAVGGVPEIIQHEATGLLVAAGDQPALVREVLRLVDEPPLRTRLGLAAKQASETEFSLKTAADTLIAQYERLVRR